MYDVMYDDAVVVAFSLGNEFDAAEQKKAFFTAIKAKVGWI